jgi:hypothetical protein
MNFYLTVQLNYVFSSITERTSERQWSIVDKPIIVLLQSYSHYLQAEP